MQQFANRYKTSNVYIFEQPDKNQHDIRDTEAYFLPVDFLRVNIG